MRDLNKVPKLGVGIVWWPELDALCRPSEGLVHAIEAEPAARAPLSQYRFLAQEGRASSLVVAAPHSIRALLRALGEAETRKLLSRFWQDASPAYTIADEGNAFLAFLAVTVPVHAAASPGVFDV